ncbi:nuclear transport factor 2 family protein [Sphingobacteriales bacterium UPWRP_1]|nr:hypothetical protein B6N25_13560 [Sphingobacteriales bacterium TSM_CSS]PSJ76811.1 nuclear transport factor 2 family protein [Sphingobacteriales bacterium UPWRP_1]
MFKTSIIVLLCAVLLLPAVSCSKKTVPTIDLKKAKAELLDTDRAFSKMCGQQGMKSAFLYYAADEAIRMNEGKFPQVGKTELKAFFDASPGAATAKQLKWEPIKADIAASGDMGYTFGQWEFAQKDTTLYGYYVSIWKKQSNGTWKYVLDAGNSAPGKHK